MNQPPKKDRMHLQRILAFCLILALTLLPASPPIPYLVEPGTTSTGWRAKIDPAALRAAASGESEYLLVLGEQADLSHAAHIESKEARGQAVFEALTKTAHRSQAPVIAEIQQLGLSYTAFWIVNMIQVRGGPEVLEQLAQLDQVERIHANPSVPLRNSTPEAQISAAAAAYRTLAAPDAVEWNILQVNADDVWRAGFRGQGIVVGGQDTGYQWDHPALKASYRGWNGAAADHNYHWHDAIHQADASLGTENTACPFNSPVPCDDNGHGTHTMGTIVGSDGSSNQIGMAPEARWIGCRNMDRGIGTPATYAECYQWFAAPTDLSGANPRPDLAPDVINNSWSCPPSEGCTEPDVLRLVVENVRAAGILTVHSAGNTSLGQCSTIVDPAAIYDASFTVGATDNEDNIAGFSSRGPVTIDDSSRLKPDLVAPGAYIRSSILNNSYGYSSGTSMAAPHVAGTAALILSAQPLLRGQVDSLEALLAQTALPIPSSECDGSAGVPNNVYGWGRLDALAALNGHALSVSKSASSIVFQPGGVLTYTLHVTHTAVFSPTTNLVLRDRLPEGTVFLSASGDYSQEGDVITWNIDSLAANASASVQLQLAVAAPMGGSGELVNWDYGVSSAERGYIAGLPVRTFLHTRLLPMLFLNAP
jgi:serine protease AprX